MKLPRVAGDQVVKALKRAEFEEVSMRGSHCHLYHHGKNKIVTVPAHAGNLEEVLETMDILAYVEMVTAIAESEEEIRRSETRIFKDFIKEVGLEDELCATNHTQI